MKVELTDKEIMNLGQNRWMRTHWKRFVFYIGIPLVLLLVASIVMPKDFSVQGKYAIFAVLVLAFIVPYWYFFFNTDKIGKKFLAEQKSLESK